MLTRKECQDMVSRPGKFENEPIYSPYFWDIVMNGFSDDILDDNGETIDVCFINEKDLTLFPELKGTYAILIFQDNSGFVYCVSKNQKEYRAYIDSLEPIEDYEIF